jgi:hypothetical protein
MLTYIHRYSIGQGIGQKDYFLAGFLGGIKRLALKKEQA